MTWIDIACAIDATGTDHVLFNIVNEIDSFVAPAAADKWRRTIIKSNPLVSTHTIHTVESYIGLVMLLDRFPPYVHIRAAADAYHEFADQYTVSKKRSNFETI